MEPFALLKLVVLDLDGTLISHADDSPATEIWTRRVSLVARLNYYRVALTVATGRAYAGARRLAEIVSPQKSTPFILYNGSAVISGDGALLAHTAINEVSLRSLIDSVQRTGGSALTYWLRADFSGRLEDEWPVFIGHGPAPEREFNGLAVVTADQVPPGASCVAALLWAEDSDVRKRLHDAVRQIEGLSVTASGSRFIEVRPAGSTKAAGLNALLRNLQIEPSTVMAIGDNDNDVELLDAVGISVCVANASSSAQAVSRFMAQYPSSQGVIEALDLVIRARRLWAGRYLKHGNQLKP
jgi:Cof subfamily protein (haloacid dehalogenase superfamily)